MAQWRFPVSWDFIVNGFDCGVPLVCAPIDKPLSEAALFFINKSNPRGKIFNESFCKNSDSVIHRQTHAMEALSALQVLYEVNPPIITGFPSERARNEGFSMMLDRTNCWAISRSAGDLKSHFNHVMPLCMTILKLSCCFGSWSANDRLMIEMYIISDLDSTPLTNWGRVTHIYVSILGHHCLR